MIFFLTFFNFFSKKDMNLEEERFSLAMKPSKLNRVCVRSFFV